MSLRLLRHAANFTLGWVGPAHTRFARAVVYFQPLLQLGRGEIARHVHETAFSSELGMSFPSYPHGVDGSGKPPGPTRGLTGMPVVSQVASFPALRRQVLFDLVKIPLAL